MRHHDQDSLAISRITLGCRICGLFRDGVQFCSGLVDLVVGVGHHGGGGHRLALVGERFVGLVAEHFAQVGDRGVDLGDELVSGVRAKPAMVAADSWRPSRSKKAASQPGEAHMGGVARVVVVADRQVR